MQCLDVRERKGLTDIMRKPLVILLALLFFSACPSKKDSPDELAKSEPSPVVEIPFASASPPAPVPSASAFASASAPEPAPIAMPVDPETVTAVIAWREDPSARGGYRSLWIERDADKPKVVNERPGVLFVSSTSLWTLEITIVKGCSQNAQLPNGEPFVINNIIQMARPDMEMPELTRISDGKRVAPWKDGHGYPYMGTQCPDGIETYTAHIAIKGGMGPFIGARFSSYTYSGGAHGVRTSHFFTINLENTDSLDLLPQETDRQTLAENAAKHLGADPKDVTPDGTLLMYGPNGTGLALYRYWAPASYAGGMGESSYSIDYDVSSKNLPKEVKGYDKLPAWTLPLLKPKSIPVFMVPPAKMALFKSQFDSAYPTPKKP